MFSGFRHAAPRRHRHHDLQVLQLKALIYELVFSHSLSDYSKSGYQIEM
jgi:hypothetical protein